jgi:hypothetical protein
VFREWLGMSAADLASMRDEGIVWPGALRRPLAAADDECF